MYNNLQQKQMRLAGFVPREMFWGNFVAYRRKEKGQGWSSESEETKHTWYMTWEDL